MRTAVLFLLLFVACGWGHAVVGQSTEFSYQGRLTNSGAPASGNHDFEFLLFDALSGGTQLGSTLTINTVEVIDGSFTVTLNFGAHFPGANRFLEIRVRPSGGGAFTPLTPRQQINSTPYSIKSLSADTAVNATSAATAANATNAATATNALQLGGVAANQYVLTGDARLSDARNPLPGSANYIQNSTNPQASSNFNISGTGTANIFNAATQFNLGGTRALWNTGSNNIFVGTGAGNVNSGGNNSFVGFNSGFSNTSGQGNTFFGVNGGFSNTTGNFNTTIGWNANFGSGGLTNATAIGFRAFANQSNSIVLGSINGVNGATTDTSVGIGTTTPSGAFEVITKQSRPIYITQNGTGELFGGRIIGRGSRPGALQAEDEIFAIGAEGDNGNGFQPGVSGLIAFVATENWSGTNRGGRIDFYTRPNSSNSLWQRMILDQNGNLGLTAEPTERLSVGGNALITGNLTVGGSISGNLPAGSGSYIQNQNAGVQASSNFSISGVGTGLVFDATGEYRLNGTRILDGAVGSGNLFLGNGGAQVSNLFNTFIGYGAGLNTTNGRNNTLVGANAGNVNQAGWINTFVGTGSGSSNTNGNGNTFIGNVAGNTNQTGEYNTVLGADADVGSAQQENSTAIGAKALVTANNSIVLGSIDGINGGTANTNVGIGTTAPSSRLHVVGNSLFDGRIVIEKHSSGVDDEFNGTEQIRGIRNSGSTVAPGPVLSLQNLIQIAAYGYVSSTGVSSGSSALISMQSSENWSTTQRGARINFYTNPNGTNSLHRRMMIDHNGNVGIGVAGAPSQRLQIGDNGGTVSIGGGGCSSGFVYLNFSPAPNCQNYSILGDGVDTMFNAPTSGTIHFRIGNITRASISSGGIFSVNILGTSGGTALCRNASNQIAACSSSIRYKSDINNFVSGLEIVKKLNPISFKWKDGGMTDLGLVAEDVAKIEPLLTTTNDKGEIEGVKYDRVGVVLVNAVKEQQVQIEAQQQTIDKQRTEIDVLKRELAELKRLVLDKSKD